MIGRYCKFKANALAGVNLTAPVVQLQVVVTMVLAVVVLGEPCTALQMIGGALILFGSLITQRAPARTAWWTKKSPRSPVRPRYLAGYVFAALAASLTAPRRSWRASRWSTPDRRPACSVA